jgi:hypothetical protein
VLVWRRRNPAPAMREFIRIARGSLHDHDAPRMSAIGPGG